MSVKSVSWGLVVLALCAAAYAVYAPQEVEKLSPQAADLARALRAKLPLPAAGTQEADGKPEAAPAPAAVPVEAQTVEKKDFPVVLESLGQVLP